MEDLNAPKKHLTIEVKCYAGYMGEETPISFFIGDRQIAIVEVVDRWLAPDHRYFKVLGDDKAIYIIRHDMLSKIWELTFFRKDPGN